MGNGNDYVLVGGGAERFEGEAGHDYISYYNSRNGVMIDLESSEVSGSWAANDSISGFESASGSKRGHDTMYGTSEHNRLRGYGGNDTLEGRGGDDKLWGGDGEDYIDGGAGADLLYGGADSDIFHFNRGEDHDIIKDFEDNADTIHLVRFNFAQDVDVFDLASQVGSDVVFDFGGGALLTVENTTIEMLHDDLLII